MVASTERHRRDIFSAELPSSGQASSCRLDPARDPLVEAEAFGTRAQGRAAMDLRSDAERDLAAVGPIRRLAAFGTECEVIVDAVAERPFDLGEGLAFEGDDIPQAADAARKGAIVGLVCTPACSTPFPA